MELAQNLTGQISLTVKDNGIGLRPEIDIYQSKSLGLQLVCTLAEQIYASLQVDREGGTSFQVTLQGES
jgi:two-component sensor histidine kinase